MWLRPLRHQADLGIGAVHYIDAAAVQLFLVCHNCSADLALTRGAAKAAHAIQL